MLFAVADTARRTTVMQIARKQIVHSDTVLSLCTEYEPGPLTRRTGWTGVLRPARARWSPSAQAFPPDNGSPAITVQRVQQWPLLTRAPTRL